MKILFAAFAVLLAFAGLAHAETPASPSGRVVLPDEVIPERYDIKVTPNAETLTFTGEVKITLNVQKVTDRIVLNAADLTIGGTALSGRSETPKVVLDETQQTAAFVFEKPVAPGRYVLSIDYTGKIYQQARASLPSTVTRHRASDGPCSHSSRTLTRGGLSPHGTNQDARPCLL